MRHLFIVFLLSGLMTSLNAGPTPSALDCTGPTGADATTVVAAQQAWAQQLGEASHEKTFSLDATGKTTIEMVLIPPGKYFRGEGKSTVLITLTQPLWVGKYEVTQRQYAAVMGNNPSHFKRDETAAYPVETVSHVSAVNFCKTVSSNTGVAFRLLREAEWEYAYRAGTRTKYYNGDADEKVGDIAHYGESTGRISPQKVGTRAPNAFGLHDMAGNVWEWCSDYWSSRYDMRTTIDPLGPESGQGCVTRGSSWSSSADGCRAAKRSRDAETYGGSHLGFRVACVPAGLAKPAPPATVDCSGPDGADADAVQAAQRVWAAYLGEASHQRRFALDNAGKVTVDMILLPPGKYYRGRPGEAVLTTLTKPLWVGKYEVTQEQYAAVMGRNPSHFKRDEPDAASCPVEMVSHLDARKFCETASKNTGSKFQLLTVAQWEYAYRSGTRTKYYNGNDDARATELAQCTENNYVRTAKVGTKLPNAFGLYDMGGNVSEWCADFWDRDFVETETIDPTGPQKSSKLGRIRVHRGNAWDSYARTCHATSGGASSETYGGSQLGFRLARIASRRK